MPNRPARGDRGRYRALRETRPSESGCASPPLRRRAEPAPPAARAAADPRPAAPAAPAEGLVFECNIALARWHSRAGQRVKSAEAVIGEPQGAAFDVEHQSAG